MSILSNDETLKKKEIYEKRYKAKIQRFVNLLNLNSKNELYECMITKDTERNRLKELIDRIESDSKLMESSKMHYLSALGCILKNEDIDTGQKQRMKQMVVQYKKQVDLREKRNLFDTKKEKQRFRNWHEIIEIYMNLENLCHDATYLPSKLYKTWQQYLVMALYIEWEPIRLDYGHVRVFEGWKDMDVLPPPDDREHSSDPELNYIVGKEFHLNHDKVAHHKKSEIRELPPKIIEIMNEIRERFGEFKYLLSKEYDRNLPLTDRGDIRKNAFTYLLKQIPLPGKIISPSNLSLAEIHTSHANILDALAKYGPSPGPSNLSIDSIRSARATFILQDPTKSTLDKETLAREMRTSLRQLEQSYLKIKVQE